MLRSKQSLWPLLLPLTIPSRYNESEDEFLDFFFFFFFSLKASNFFFGL